MAVAIPPPIDAPPVTRKCLEAIMEQLRLLTAPVRGNDDSVVLTRADLRLLGLKKEALSLEKPGYDFSGQETE